MVKRNCPNCGAPYDIELNKCPYCGTSYYDLSSLDFTNNAPFYLKIKITNCGHNYYITQLVRPFLRDISITSSTYECAGINNRLFGVLNPSIITNIEFEALPNSNTNEYIRIEERNY